MGRNMINLRKAKANEARKILQFYRNLIDSIEGSEFKPKWSEDYPDLEYIKSSIEKEELYLYKEDNDIVSSIVLNHEFNPEYKDIVWNIDAKSDEIIVMHAFAVDSNFSGKGIGKEVFNQIKSNALEKNIKTIRIDIIEGNTGGKRVFEKFGFEYIDTVEIFHEIVGLEKFHLYEYVLGD